MADTADVKIAELERRLAAAKQEAARYRIIAEKLGESRLREIDRLNRLILSHRQTEEALRESEEKYRNILETIQEGYFESDLEGRFIFFNSALVRILGYPREELMGRPCSGFLTPETARTMRRASEPVHRREEPREILDFQLVTRSGEIRTLEVSLSSLLNREGEVIGLRGLGRDVTDRLMAQSIRQQLEAQLQKAMRMEAIGALAGGIAHNFNNLLMGIQGNLSLILMDLDPEDPQHIPAKRIERCVLSGADLVKQLLGFARGGKHLVRTTDLNALVEKTAVIVDRTRKDIRIRLSLTPDLWTVDADPVQLEQVFLNLYVNAWQAMPGGGDLVLESRNSVVGKEEGEALELMPGRYVRISVADTGIGMDEDTRQRIFEPFFTTKEKGQGSGLGLASALGIVKNHGGAIEVRSAPGQGTVFSILLPAGEQRPAPPSPVQEGTILLVDDETLIRDAVPDILRREGYVVITARSGREALSVFDEQRERIDLVILNLIMPGMGGAEVYPRIRSMCPGVRVLFTSGYPLTGKAEEILHSGNAGFIQKPFTPGQLSLKIREILGQPSRAA